MRSKKNLKSEEVKNMGKTYKKLPKRNRYDDESSLRSGRGSMKTLNSYVDEDYDLDDDSFDDEIEISDDIQIQHIQNDNTN
jgi:hypothetical protein